MSQLKDRGDPPATKRQSKAWQCASKSALGDLGRSRARQLSRSRSQRKCTVGFCSTRVIVNCSAAAVSQDCRSLKMPSRCTVTVPIVVAVIRSKMYMAPATLAPFSTPGAIGSRRMTVSDTICFTSARRHWPTWDHGCRAIFYQIKHAQSRKLKGGRFHRDSYRLYGSTNGTRLRLWRNT